MTNPDLSTEIEERIKELRRIKLDADFNYELANQRIRNIRAQIDALQDRLTAKQGQLMFDIRPSPEIN